MANITISKNKLKTLINIEHWFGINPLSDTSKFDKLKKARKFESPINPMSIKDEIKFIEPRIFLALECLWIILDIKTPNWWVQILNIWYTLKEQISKYKDASNIDCSIKTVEEIILSLNALIMHLGKEYNENIRVILSLAHHLLNWLIKTVKEKECANYINENNAASRMINLHSAEIRIPLATENYVSWKSRIAIKIKRADIIFWEFVSWIFFSTFSSPIKKKETSWSVPTHILR